jgi:zinc protease
MAEQQASRVPVALLALALAVAAVVAHPVRAGLFNPETATLANGLEVVVIPDHRAPVVTHMIWYRVGAADDPSGKSGLAHFLEHLMFKGTPSAPGDTFSALVAGRGGAENAFTSLDYTAYFQTVPVQQLDAVMRLEADRMVNLVLREDEVALEREVILEERRSRTDNDPSALLSEQMSATLYLAHPYRIPVIGWEHEMRGLTLDDARAFYERHYVPSNAVLVIAGDVTLAEVLPLAEAHYGTLPARARPPRDRAQEPPQRANRRVEFRDSRVTRASWRRIYIAPSANRGATEHALPLMLLADILGGGSNSRLYRALVVDRELAAGAGSFYSVNRLDDSQFGIYAAPNPGGEIADIEAAVAEVVAELLAEGVTEQELERSKRGMRASATYARDNMRGIAHIFGVTLLTGATIEDIESWPERVSAVTAAEVAAAAHHVLDGYHVTGLLLPELAEAETAR